MRTLQLLPLSCLVASTFATSCRSTLAEEELRHFPGPVETLHLRQRDGDVTVTMTPRTDVRVVTRSHHIGSERPSIQLDLRDGTLEAGYTREPGVGGSSVDFDIELPSGVTEVVARADGGDLDLYDLFGDIDVRTDTGDVEGESLFTSSARVTTRTGDVELEFASPPEWVDVETDTGDVEISLPGSGWNVLVQTDTGDVEIEPGMVGDSGERRIRVTTRTGDVHIERR